MDYTVYRILQARILGWVAFPFSRGSSQLRVEPRPPALRADSLPAETQGKPKNTGVGSLFLLQQIPDPGTELGSPAFQTDSLPTELSGVFKSIVTHRLCLYNAETSYWKIQSNHLVVWFTEHLTFGY